MNVEEVKKNIIGKIPQISSNLEVYEDAENKEIVVRFKGNQKETKNEARYDSSLSLDEIIKKATQDIFNNLKSPKFRPKLR